jgi:hypothetical protein
MARKKDTYLDVLTEAINDMITNGFDSIERVSYWTERLRKAANQSAKPSAKMEQMLREMLASTYKTLLSSGKLQTFHLGLPERFTLDMLKPELRAELDRRIYASASLIKRNRAEAIEKTLARFQGWSTSIPAGGAAQARRQKIKKDIRKSMTGLPFEERRVLIDQGHKLTASLNDIIANDGGAIAGEWHSRWRQANYNYRVDHKDRDKCVYLIRDSWAHKAGLVKPNKNGYTDEITQPAEEPFCRCSYHYLYAISSLPADMLTKKGQSELARVRQIIKSKKAA